jgi:hypothetical protein
MDYDRLTEALRTRLVGDHSGDLVITSIERRPGPGLDLHIEFAMAGRPGIWDAGWAESLGDHDLPTAVGLFDAIVAGHVEELMAFGERERGPHFV